MSSQESLQYFKNNFLAELKYERQLSKLTLEHYERDLNKFFKFIEADENFLSASKISQKNIQEYLIFEHKKKLTSRTLRRNLSAIKSFFKFLIKKKIILIDPTIGVNTPKIKEYLPKTFDADEVKVLLDKEASSDIEIRDFAIMELLYSCGLRLSELTKLDIADIQSSDNILRVIGKGNKERLIPIGRHAQTALQRWLDIIKKYQKIDKTALFISLGKSNKRITNRAVQKRLEFYTKKYSLDKTLHPHVLRHSFASHMLESSGDLRAIQELLGHADIATTQIYTQLNFQYLAEVYDKAHPRSKKEPSSEISD